MALTDTSIKALKPKSSPYKAFDGGGLYIEVLPSGSRVWRIKVKMWGKDKRITLGHYPAITLKEARELLLEAKKKIAQGINPTGATMAAAAVSSFESVALEWIQRKSPVWSAGHVKTVSYRLDRFVFPHIGVMDMAAITPVDVLRLIRPIENTGKNHTAHRVLGICSQVFRYGVATGRCKSDPCRDLSDALTCYAEKPRAAIVSKEGAGKLMAKIGGYKSLVMRCLLLWSAYTFCRPGEVRQAEWSEIDYEENEWRIPAEKMKMRFEHRVPLSSQCLAILETLRAAKILSKWIFPSVKDRMKPISEAGALSAIRGMGYEKEEMTPHGFRAMASTLLNEMGFDPDVIERQLAHGDMDKVRAVYNRAAYMEQRRAMMQTWADALDAWADTYSRPETR